VVASSGGQLLSPSTFRSENKGEAAMSAIDVEVLEYLKATQEHERVLRDYGDTIKDYQEAMNRWLAAINTPDSAELASRVGEISRRMDDLRELCRITKERWEAICAKVDVVRVVSALTEARPRGSA
jgi:chromosome condensin MukBEF ATPase and DNA-binding subunit MukB